MLFLRRGGGQGAEEICHRFNNSNPHNTRIAIQWENKWQKNHTYIVRRRYDSDNYNLWRNSWSLFLLVINIIDGIYPRTFLATPE